MLNTIRKSPTTIIVVIIIKPLATSQHHYTPDKQQQSTRRVTSAKQNSTVTWTSNHYNPVASKLIFYVPEKWILSENINIRSEMELDDLIIWINEKSMMAWCFLRLRSCSRNLFFIEILFEAVLGQDLYFSFRFDKVEANPACCTLLFGLS